VNYEKLQSTLYFILVQVPCYEAIALCPAFFVLKKKNNVTMG
jgi:hypothetical protein